MKMPIPREPGTFPPGVKKPGCETDHSSQSRAEAKNAWNYTSNPLYVFMECCKIKHRNYLKLPSSSELTPHDRYVLFLGVIK
jgi:hypothetical protein